MSYWSSDVCSSDLVSARGEGMRFANVAEAQRAFDNGLIDLHARVVVRIKEYEVDLDGERTEKISRYETTVGRALLSEILPAGLPFSLIDRALKKDRKSTRLNSSH